MSNRRQIIAYAFTEERQVSSLYISPATAKLAGAALQAAASYYSGAQEASRHQEIVGMLNRISEQLDEIIDLLKNLKIWTDERITEEARRLIVSEIEAIRRISDEIISGNASLSPENIEQLNKNLYQIRISVHRLSIWAYYGFPYYPAVISAVSTCLVLFKICKTSKNEVSIFCESILRYLSESKNIGNVKSIEFSRNQAALSFLNNENDFNSILNRDFIVNMNKYSGGGGLREGPDRPDRYEYWLVRFVGNWQEGVSASTSRGTGAPPNADWFPDIPEHYDMGDSVEKSTYFVQQIVESKRSGVRAAHDTVIALEDQLSEISECEESLKSIVT